MNVKIHEKYIKRCIQIAKNGWGTTAPNPMVGCVIIHNHKIIAEGFTSPYGGPHAEVNAINAVKDKSLLSTSTLYVTLEPCSHFGKTPPCSDLITQYKIPKVVIGCIDSHSKVAGKGIAKLQISGCEVIVGVLEKECLEHHKRFFTFHNKKRPYIILKWAQTSDGFIAPLTRNEQKPVWITNPLSRQLVHFWRTREQAILVGTKTVLEDNPSLTSRDWTGNNPIRVVLDRTEKLNKSLSVFDSQANTITLTEKDMDFTKDIAQQIADKLYEQEITSVIIEGGTKTLQTFIDSDLWDEARIFIGTTRFQSGIKGPKFSGDLKTNQRILDDCLNIYKPKV